MTCMLRNKEEDIQKIFDIEVDCALPSFLLGPGLHQLPLMLKVLLYILSKHLNQIHA